MSGSRSASSSTASSPHGFTSSLIATLKSVKVEHLVAGVTGGVVSTLILHPLDLLKIRFAVDDGKAHNRPSYTGLVNAFSSIYKQEGFRGLYKGVIPNVAGAGTAWGFYFLFYNTVKTEMQGGDTKLQLTPGMHMLAAAEAGILTLAMTNPIWVVKTRLCLQYGITPIGKTSATGCTQYSVYKGMKDALVRIAKEEGFRGLYKGFVPGIWGVSHGAIQFMAYEELKNVYCRHKNQAIDTKLGTTEYLFFAALSKLLAAVTTYPYQVVRARLQDQQTVYGGAVDCVRMTYRSEGFVGLFKGLGPNLLKVVPATAITLATYESVSHLLLTRHLKKPSEPSQE